MNNLHYNCKEREGERTREGGKKKRERERERKRTGREKTFAQTQKE